MAGPNRGSSKAPKRSGRTSSGSLLPCLTSWRCSERSRVRRSSYSACPYTFAHDCRQLPPVALETIQLSASLHAGREYFEAAAMYECLLQSPLEGSMVILSRALLCTCDKPSVVALSADRVFSPVASQVGCRSVGPAVRYQRCIRELVAHPDDARLLLPNRSLPSVREPVERRASGDIQRTQSYSS